MGLSELGPSELDDRSLLYQVCHPDLHKLADSRVREPQSPSDGRQRDERPLGVADLARSEPHQDDKLDEVSVLRHGALGLSQCLHVKHVSILVLYVIQFLGLSSITLYQTFN